MDFKNGSIGFFDSGIGGISILGKTMKLLENEVFIYFGDSRNSPYGSKSESELINLSINICNFLIFENNCKAIVVACNTASSAAIRFLRERYEPKIPIIGVEPAIKPAVEFVNSNNKKGYILLLATPFTVNGDKLRCLINKYSKNTIECFALDYLAYMIEHNESEQSIYDYLYERLHKYINNVSCIVLGCTHYYFVKNIIKDIFGEGVRIFDGSLGTAMELRRRLIENNLINKTIDNLNTRVQIYNSLDNEKVLRCHKILSGVI
ncbi:glutamate racemase [Candidatus Arthromitus sp. SFB-mouse-Japan]|uniref:glutamate racemase n=1 Tax=Candidatus Arthromitus sp. SFB-mouse TaxID=49118 RepID=UPI00021B819C|nr:glutamate racemase [Candidatus Arthromitus sp. SFB-mouse]EIA24769.1 Glutamate racemase [Candidatus Arthromitus sp. SFB-1]EIA27598.1 Glutamate racemase [Candidatus Arthromitus sp. SFB-co]EIA27808.1 Glutamate racemase [Candidatus Arthromitus sp. SFB-5]EIA29722.1 Glutamate racemase [Candidatus Arthromitus sp. SFB-mouse-SU]EGX28091.1 glutamate racemase [Candidatus Arthromitus sp. SFB-mouse-NYU]